MHNTIGRLQIESIVLDSIRLTNKSRESDSQLEVSSEAPIFGSGSPLDSMGLVALLLDIEDRLSEEGISIFLSDERAMSEHRNPYRDVPTLVALIESRISSHE